MFSQNCIVGPTVLDLRQCFPQMFPKCIDWDFSIKQNRATLTIIGSRHRLFVLGIPKCDAAFFKANFIENPQCSKKIKLKLHLDQNHIPNFFKLFNACSGIATKDKQMLKLNTLIYFRQIDLLKLQIFRRIQPNLVIPSNVDIHRPDLSLFSVRIK